MLAVPSKRYRTAKKIQETAVQLAMRDGLANTTTEAIAREAGISTRSFFNYYPYKEAAIMGPSPGYPKDAADNFIISRGKLIDDLKVMISAHLRRFEAERDLLADVLTLAENDPKLEALRSSSILARRIETRDLLRKRMPTENEVYLEILSSSVLSATNMAIRHWSQRKVDNFIATAHKYLDMIVPSAELLNETVAA
ncbi:MAG: TetR/AcrR family transcriptional regulator [Sphingomonadaceae bacterium]